MKRKIDATVALLCVLFSITFPVCLVTAMESYQCLRLQKSGLKAASSSNSDFH